MGLNKGVISANRESSGDECYTPYYAVEPLLEFIPQGGVIWCAFDEEWSAFYNTFKDKGYNVVRSSLKEGQDFFEYEPEHWDMLISNPPFSRKDEVLERAFSFDKPFALLLPVNTIQGKKRFDIFRNQIQLLIFDSRIDYHTNGNMQTTSKGCFFGSAYFCRDILPTKLEMRKLNKYEKGLV